MGIISASTIRIGLWPQPHRLRLWATDSLWPSSTSSFRIFDVNISPASVGSTFTLSSGPIFQQTVDFLTNGQVGGAGPSAGHLQRAGIGWILGNGGGAGGGQPKRFFNGGYPTVDLRGCTIEGLDLRLDEFAEGPVPLSEDTAYWVTFTLVIRGKSPWGRWVLPWWWDWSWRQWRVKAGQFD